MIKLISSMATREILADLIVRYQTSTSRTVEAEAGGGVDVARRVQEGESFDVVVLAATAIDQLIAAGKLLAGSRVDLVKSGVSIAVRTGAPVPDVSTEDAVRQAVMAARTISYSTGPSGVYLLKLFERWGMLDAIKPRIVQAPPGVPVGSLVAKGEVELGFQQLSELINLSGITVVGPLPPAIQTITTFSAAVCATSLKAGLAASLIAFMAAPEAACAKRKQGMEPA
jgi:molybdate transport system substrate-binding protein